MNASGWPVPSPLRVRFFAGAALAVLLAAGAAGAVPIPEGRPAIRFFDPEQGLPQNTPLSFAVDARGLLWAGTFDGAAFYDGRSWTAVNMPNRTESNEVNDILFTPDGDAWFATTGVARLHDGQWTLFGPAAGLPADEVFRLAAESDGSRTVLWAGTERGLARWDGTSWTMVTIAGVAGLPGQRITALLTVQTEKGSALWVGTERGVARRGPDGRWSVFPAVSAIPADNSGPPAAPVVDLLETREAGRSILWAATDGGGLARYDGERWTVETGLPSPRVLCLAMLESGGESGGDREVWAGTAQGLARRRTGGTWTVYNAENAGLPVDQISRLFAGRSGGRPLLWIGLSTGGLGVLDPGGWQILDHRSSGLPRSPVFGLAETGPADDPVYWFSTQNRGLARWQAGRWTVFSEGTPVAHAEVNVAVPTGGAQKNALWVGTSRGLFRWENGIWTPFSGWASGLPDSEVLAVLESRTPSGTVLWVGTRAGLARCAAGRCTLFTPENSPLPDRQVYSLLETHEAEGKVLWIGTRAGGLARLSGSQWTLYNTRTSPLPNDWINTLRETRSGARRFLWIATNGGVVRLDLNDLSELKGGFSQWLLLNERDSQPRLPNNYVYQILDDARGRIYLTTNRGVERLTPNPSAPNGYDGYTFTVRDGLPFAESNQWSSLVDRAGRLWIGTSTAVAWLDPAAPEPRASPSPLLVERVTVDDRELPWTGAPLRLGEGPGEVTFEYALLSYFREPDIRYRVQLVGWQSSPSDWLPEPVQRYSHLAPGSYRFRVWGRDAAGVVSGPLEIPFLIPQSPWRTGWASLLYAVVAALLVGGGVRWRIGVLKQRTLRLEELVRERTESLAATVRDLGQSEQAARAAKEEADRANRFKSDFLANMSHEIRTPMNAVIGMTSILAGTRLTAEQNDYVGTIRSSGESLLGLLNDILDLSKIEAGMLAIELAPFALRQCVEEAVDLLAAEAQRKGLEIGCCVDPAVPAVIESDATRLRQILVNLLANAVKFTAAGKILLTVTVSSSSFQDDSVELCFDVLDTGIGISAEHMDRLFRPFSQADSSTARLYGGTGLGLAISQRLVERLGGRIWAESRPGEGSRFRFTIRCRLADAVPLLSPQRDHEPAADLSPLRILVAEDNAVNQKVLLLMLQRLGSDADVAADGEEVLAALRRQRYDVVLMDVQMPRMDGIEATRRIRAEWPAAERPRIIAVTANALREDREICLAAGMDDYLSKPLLLENLRAALSHGAGAASHDEDTAKDFDPQRIDQLRQLQAMTGQDLVSPIIDRFLADSPRRLEDLRAALDAQDGPQLSFAAHAFKGSSGQIGACRLAALCQELESQGQDDQWNDAAEIVAQLGIEIERVAPLLLEFLHAKQGEQR